MRQRLTRSAASAYRYEGVPCLYSAARDEHFREPRGFVHRKPVAGKLNARIVARDHNVDGAEPLQRRTARRIAENHLKSKAKAAIAELLAAPFYMRGERPGQTD